MSQGLKTTFELTLFDDDRVKAKLKVMSPLEAMFDDERNILPVEYDYFTDDIPLGSTIRITLEQL